MRESESITAPQPVTARVERRNLVDSISEDGTLKAYRVYSFYPDVGNNPLRTLHVAEGQTVHENDPLFAFDTEQLDAERDLLRARRDAAQAKLDLLRERRTGRDAVEARQRVIQRQQEHEDAARALEIKTAMVEQGLASPAEAEALEARARAAALGAEGAALQHDEVQTHVRSPEMLDLEVQIRQHQDALRQLEKQREQFLAVAPFDARILRINDAIKNLSPLVDKIELYFPRGRGPLMILADTDKMRVVTRFFERDIARIRVGQTARVSSKHVPDKVFEGEVVLVSELGDTVGQTTTVEVEVLVSNTEHLLKPGLKAETRVIVGEADNVLTVPVEFLRYDNGQTFVRRVTAEDETEKVTIQTGISDGRYTEVTSDLRENDLLVME